jgi:hypothetical protein
MQERADKKHEPKGKGELETIGVGKATYHHEEKKPVKERLTGIPWQPAELQVQASINGDEQK